MLPELFLQYVTEREAIRMERIEFHKAHPNTLFVSKKFPFNERPFCNNARILDRWTQYSIREAFVDGYDLNKRLMVILLTRLFMNLSIVRSVMENLPDGTRHAVAAYKKALLEGHRRRNAYLSGKVPMDEQLEALLNLVLSGKVRKQESLEDLYNLFVNTRGFGKFISFQLAQDANYVLQHDHRSFVVLGPGAIRGLEKLRIPKRQWIDWVLKAPYELPQYMATGKIIHPDGLRVPIINKFYYTPADVQNMLCEFDKWTRLTNPGLGHDKKVIRYYTPSPFRMPEILIPANLM